MEAYNVYHTWPGNTQEARTCIVYTEVIDRLLTFSHIFYWKWVIDRLLTFSHIFYLLIFGGLTIPLY